MTTAVKKQTTIDLSSVSTLRRELDKAIQTVLETHGLRGNLGRITYEVGQEFRCKLTVIQPATNHAKNAEPKVGESWRYGNYTYLITDVRGQVVIGTRSAKVRGWGMMDRSYRIKLANIMASGVKLKN